MIIPPWHPMVSEPTVKYKWCLYSSPAVFEWYSSFQDYYNAWIRGIRNPLFNNALIVIMMLIDRFLASSGYFAYVEASSAKRDDVAILTSPQIHTSSRSTCIKWVLYIKPNPHTLQVNLQEKQNLPMQSAKTNIGAKYFILCRCLLKWNRSYVYMCKRYLTPPSPKSSVGIP